ncbi:MAG TPA: DNA-binding response regulator [Colwellia sp.]|nr:DNA-binding response regulator [Colwellia sp.]|tara:strand:- start:2264 stop:2959 length:696 start_codon:yes stop_codon:yes gene_type:complete
MTDRNLGKTVQSILQTNPDNTLESKIINVALVDDQQLVRQGIAGLLTLSDDINIIWQAEDGEQAQLKLSDQQPDVLLLDIRMPKISGIELVKILRAQGNSLPILMLTTFDDSELFMQSLQAGANGFLLKDVSLEKLVNAVKTLAEGGFVAEPVVMKQMNKGFDISPVLDKLSEKENQIVKLMAGGFSNKEIAASIFLAEGTVKNHVSNILSKLNTRDRTRAVLIALNEGII